MKHDVFRLYVAMYNSKRVDSAEGLANLPHVGHPVLVQRLELLSC